MNQELLNKYAAFTVQVGVNVQKGQTLIIRCPVEGAYFGRRLHGSRLKAGAGTWSSAGRTKRLPASAWSWARRKP